MVSMVSGLRTQLKIWELQFRGTEESTEELSSCEWHDIYIQLTELELLFSYKCKCCHYYLRHHNRKKGTPQKFSIRNDED